MDQDVSKPRVVVGVDGSPSSFEAVRWAVRYAGLVGGAVEAVAAWEVPLYGWSAPAVDMYIDEEATREQMAQELTEVLGADAAAGVRTRVAHGNPAEILLRAAEGAEVLVVGSRGRGGFARVMLGSVSQRVAAHAACPVVIVRSEET
ncbi:universal stress protein [Streptomyces griseofuscus]|uniref:Nucleotide-binding universal stress UspA family protein n=5 Tax=Actinomycetes TaxID=1760 RepID=A0A7W3NJF9_STRMR|nr:MULTISPECIES: universal stress protein [Streptomyces]MYR24270.1 universal stress protein [Streptomyces sp. SID6137]NDK28678.1 universal stress protein [Streptomyces sp. TR1341]BBC98036.1 universal stress protein [Streptomyces rochei]MBA9043885.1 nucleotide-binding universal stress UspA family protein [Streptomyces murinus]MBA9051563.1 nucleotide-binding universal stress UspA family protein [Streptomyces murinus]